MIGPSGSGKSTALCLVAQYLFALIERAVVRHFPEWDKVRMDYRKIEIPVLLIYGDHDWSRPEEREANHRAYDLFEAPAIQEKMSHAVSIGITRLCLFHLVLSLAKWVEYYKQYKAVLPQDVREGCRHLFKEVQDRKVVDFRNKIVGHIWDRDQNRPVRTDEAMDRLAEVCRNDFKGFLKWINDPDGNVFPRTVVAIVEHTRDRIAEEYGLTDADLQGHRFQYPRT